MSYKYGLSRNGHFNSTNSLPQINTLLNERDHEFIAKFEIDTKHFREQKE